MIPDWKLEKYLTGDLPETEMRDLHELECVDEIFANRVKMFREDNLSILHRMPFETLSVKLNSRARNDSEFKPFLNIKLMKMASVAVLALVLVSISVLLVSETSIIDNGKEFDADNKNGNSFTMVSIESDTRIKGMGVRMEIWKKTEKGIVQLENMSNAHEGDEIQLRYLVPQKCYGLLFSMDGNGSLTMHMGDGNKSIALEPGKMVTLPFAYKLDNAPQFEKFFLLTSQNEFELNVTNIDETFKRKDIDSKNFVLRKAGE